MNRLQQFGEQASAVIIAIPVVVKAVTTATTEDIIRGAIAVVVIGAVVFQTTFGHGADPWLQSIALVLIGYYFGIATRETKNVVAEREKEKGG